MCTDHHRAWQLSFASGTRLTSTLLTQQHMASLHGQQRLTHCNDLAGVRTERQLQSGFTQPHQRFLYLVQSKTQRIKLKSANKGTTYSTQFKVQLQLAPVTLGFRIFIPGEGINGASAGQYLSPAGARHFSMPVGLQPGWPLPQGLHHVPALLQQKSPS